MKKSVVILIGIIYIAAIALVSFFGLKFKVFDEIVYVESIEILNPDLEDSDTFGKYIILTPDTVTPDADGNVKYQIEYRVHPDNATNSGVDFVYDTQNTNVTVDENGVVTFKNGGAVQVDLIARDGSGAKASIMIIYAT